MRITVKIVTVSPNAKALDIFKQLKNKSGDYKVGVSVTKGRNRATIIDAGVEECGSTTAGLYVAAITMGGLGQVALTPYGPCEQSSASKRVRVATENPGLALMGCQFAGWNLAKFGYDAMASGPGRLLSRKPKYFFEKYPRYKDESDVAVLFIEARQLPTDAQVAEIASACNVQQKDLYLIVAAPNSETGAAQICARSAENAALQLFNRGFDINRIKRAIGTAPLAPQKADPIEAMAVANDCLRYGATVNLRIDPWNKEEIETIMKNVPTEAAPLSEKSFRDILREANNDFIRIDPRVFAPACILATKNSLEEAILVSDEDAYFFVGTENAQRVNQLFDGVSTAASCP